MLSALDRTLLGAVYFAGSRGVEAAILAECQGSVSDADALGPHGLGSISGGYFFRPVANDRTRGAHIFLLHRLDKLRSRGLVSWGYVPQRWLITDAGIQALRVKEAPSDGQT